MQNVKETIALDDDEMERYSQAAYAMAQTMMKEGKPNQEVNKWLILWAKMNQAKRAFQERAGRELSEKYLGNEEKPTSEWSTLHGHIVLDGPILP